MTNQGDAARVPNLLHVLFFLVLTLFALLLSEAAILTFTHGAPVEATLKDQRLQLFANAMTYVVALGLCFFAMPIFWNRPFLVGIEWNAAKLKAYYGIAGLTVGFAAQALTAFIPHPKELPVEAIFRNPAIIWALTFFGVILGPLFEEVLFRGFLLPAIAIVIDWIRVPRSPDPIESLEGLHQWQASTGYSKTALIGSSIVTSLCFACIHGPQLGFTLPALALLVAVSMGLCWVRIHTASVAVSTFVHSCYNLSIFLTLFVSTGGFRHLDKI